MNGDGWIRDFKKDTVMKESIISLKLACQQVVSEKNWAVPGRKQANPVKMWGKVKKMWELIPKLGISPTLMHRHGPHLGGTFCDMLLGFYKKSCMHTNVHFCTTAMQHP